MYLGHPCIYQNYFVKYVEKSIRVGMFNTLEGGKCFFHILKEIVLSKYSLWFVKKISPLKISTNCQICRLQSLLS